MGKKNRNQRRAVAFAKGKALASSDGPWFRGDRIAVAALLAGFLGQAVIRNPIWLGVSYAGVLASAVYLSLEIPWVNQRLWRKVSSSIVIVAAVVLVAIHDWPQKTEPLSIANPTFATIGFPPSHGVLQFSKPVAYNYKIVDTGNVAKNMSEKAILRLAALPINTTDEDAMWSDFIGSFRFGQSMNLSMGSSGFFDTAWGNILTRSESQALTMPKPPMRLYIFGHAVYNDDLGNHTLDLCEWLQQPFSVGIWRSCDGHNGIDWHS